MIGASAGRIAQQGATWEAGVGSRHAKAPAPTHKANLRRYLEVDIPKLYENLKEEVDSREVLPPPAQRQ